MTFGIGPGAVSVANNAGLRQVHWLDADPNFGCAVCVLDESVRLLEIGDFQVSFLNERCPGR